jgi:glycine betaine/proline transport system substrate-binding protein
VFASEAGDCMSIFKTFLIILFTSTYSLDSSAAKDCKKIRFSDVGWTDIAVTTAVASEILNTLGYESKTTQLSVPVTYVGLKNKDLDVFLGNWMPTMAADIGPYQKDGSVETVGALLKGARYTLAVPEYVRDAGVTSVADLQKHRKQFHGKVFGSEPGNDGNRLVQKMITENAFGLSGWKLVESSEQVMLMQVMQAVKDKKWIVFLGWEPHPMNTKIKISYLTGADGFGPHQGSSTVFINTRKGYSQECPEVARFLKNFSFDVETENVLMGLMMDQGIEPQVAARKWIQANLKKVEKWLEGVSARDGKKAFSVIEKKFASQTVQ